MDRMSEEPPEGIKLNAHLILIHDMADLPEIAHQNPDEVFTTFHCTRFNKNLNILEAMRELQELSSEHSLLDVIPAYTINAAEALFEDHITGSIEPGKKPGLNLLSNMEPGTFKITDKSTLRVLI